MMPFGFLSIALCKECREASIELGRVRLLRIQKRQGILPITFHSS